MRACAALLCLVACAPSPREVPDAPRGSQGGVRYLLKTQEKDGSWRSTRYPGLADGASLTPLALLGLEAARAAGVEVPDAAISQAVRFLTALVRDGAVADADLSYPVYSASMATLGLVAAGAPAATVDAWRAAVARHQMTEVLGWTPADADHGGFGFAPRPPRKPQPGQLVAGPVEANISATVWALEALRAAGASAGDPALLLARQFVARCQNFGAPGDDGGFFFVRDDPVRNKAGPAPAAGRFRSYGSATADGLRAYLALGLDRDEPRVAAARRWLEERFLPDHQPGDFADSHVQNRDAVYYYYVASAALALERSGASVSWRKKLLLELHARQKPDGSWQNPDVYVQEDEPIVATAFALLALSRTH